nr:hypothetical protein [Tanacetum cinerariifolium]
MRQVYNSELSDKVHTLENVVPARTTTEQPPRKDPQMEYSKIVPQSERKNSFDIAFEVSLRHSLCLRNRSLMGRKTGRSDLVSNHLRSETDVSLIRDNFGMRGYHRKVTQFGSTALTGAGVVDGVGAGDWFF